MILALLALAVAPSTVSLVSPSAVATSEGQTALVRARIAACPADASVARFTYTLHLDAWEALPYTLTNLSGEAQPGYGGASAGWLSVWVGQPGVWGYALGSSFSVSTCGGFPLLPGQTANAGNQFPLDYTTTVELEVPAFLRGMQSWPVYAVLHAQDQLTPGFPADHHSYALGSGIEATLSVEYLEN